jgi:hypothetical protein
MKETEFPEILVSAYLPKSSGHTDRLLINKKTGALDIPEGITPTGFFLQVRIPGHGLDVVIARKDIGVNGGGYHLDEIQELESGHVWRTTAPIQVMTDQNTKLKYTPWHKRLSNRLDVFIVRPGEEVFLLQAGVVVRGGCGQETYHLIEEELWRGQIVMNQATGLWAGVPIDSSYGSFESRRPVFDFEPFRRALLRSSGGLVPRVLSEEEVNPTLGYPAPGCFRSDWYIPFMGQRGQGGAYDSTGEFVYMVGNEIIDRPRLEKLEKHGVPTGNIKLVQPDDDGVLRLRRGQDYRSLGIRSGYSKKDGPKYPEGIYLA